MKLLLGLVAFLMTPVVGLLGKTDNGSNVVLQDDIEIRESSEVFESEIAYDHNNYADEMFAPIAYDYSEYGTVKTRLQVPIKNGPLHNVSLNSIINNYLIPFNVVENSESNLTFEVRVNDDTAPGDKFSNTIAVSGYNQNNKLVSAVSTVFVSRLNGHFSVSTLSQEQADMYIELNERANNRMTVQEFDYRNNERNSPFIDYSTSTSGNTYYTFQIKEPNSAAKPLKFVAVGCLNGQGSVLSTLQTDSNGRIYKSSIPTGTDHLRLYSFSKLGTSNEIIRVEKTHDFADSYYYQDISLVQNGYGKTITINSEVDGTPSSLGRALLVLRPLIFGAKYVHDMSGAYPSLASAVYPFGFGACYDPNFESLLLGCTRHDYPDSVLHEYGHHVQNSYNFAGNFSGNHYVGKYALEEGKKAEGLRLTWGEAWPTVFSVMVGQYFPGEFNNYSGTDHIYNTQDINEDLETCSYKYGEGYEYDAICVLYDLYDPRNESYDYYYLGHQGLWDLMIDAAEDRALNTFNDFAQYFYSTHSIDETNDFAKITTEFGFSPNPIIDGIGTFSQSPLIHWRKTNAVYDANGNLDTTVPAYYSNHYEITFYDGYRTTLFTKQTNNEYYRLSDDDPSLWRTLQAAYSTHYYVRVSSYQNNGNLNTGAYKSDLFLVQKPQLADFTESFSFGSDKRIIARPIYLAPGQSIVYTVTSSRGGEVVFQTVGTEGTRLYLFNDSNALLAQSGYQSGYLAHGYYHNGFIRYSLQPNVPYKLRVEAMTQVTLSDTKLIVCRPLAFTQNWNPYNTAVSLENIVSDNFYYGLWCERYKLSLFNYTPSTSGRHSIQLSSGFDSYLYVIDSYTGQMWQDDDSAGNLDAKVTINNMVAGRKYLVAFTQYNPTNTLSDDDVEVHMWKN